MSDTTITDSGPVTDPTAQIGDPVTPSPSPDGYSPPNGDYSTNSDQGSQSAPDTTQAAAYDNAGDNTFGTSDDNQRKSYSDPTAQVGEAVSPDGYSPPQSSAPATSDPTATIGEPAQPTSAGGQHVDNPDVGVDPTAQVGEPTDQVNRGEQSDALTAGRAGWTINDTYNPPDAPRSGWDKFRDAVGSTIRDAEQATPGGQAIASTRQAALDAANPLSEQYLGGPILPDMQFAPNTDTGGNLGSAASQVFQPEQDVYNRLTAQAVTQAQDFAHNPSTSSLIGQGIPDTGGAPYVLTGQQGPLQSPTNYGTEQYLANTGNALSTVLPGQGGGGSAGIYDVPVVGGLAREAKAVWDMGNGAPPSIDIQKLEQDVASGQYTDKQLQEKYPGNEAYRILQEIANPINFMEPELIPGVTPGTLVDTLVTAPTTRALDTFAQGVRTTGWDATKTAEADSLLQSRGTLGNRGILDTSAPTAARTLTDLRTESLVTNISTTEPTVAALYDGAAKLAQYDALGAGVGTDVLRTAARDEAQQIAAELSRVNTGSDAAAGNYLDAMETIRQGTVADITAHSGVNATLDTAQQIAKGTARSAADIVPAGESDVAKILADKAQALGKGELPVRDVMQAAQSRGINLSTATPEEAQWARAEAARNLLAGDIRAAYYEKAGVRLPGTESALQKGLAGTFNAVRGLLLMASAPPLALQKFSDEWVRALIGGGVVSVRPADLATLQAGARFGAGRNLFGQGERFNSFLDSGTMRNAAIKNDVLPPMSLQPRTSVSPYGIGNTFSSTNRYGEPMTPGTRIAAAAGAPFRAIGKFNDALIGAPTQHVLLNAFYKDTKTLDQTRQAIAAKAYQDILAAGIPEEEASIARDRLATATSQRDFVRIGQDIQNTTGVPVATAPIVPETGMARGTPTGGPSTRVANDLNRTGGEPGLVRDAGSPQSVVNPADWRATYSRNLERMAQTPESSLWDNPLSDVTRANAQRAGLNLPENATNRDVARALGITSPTRTAQRAPAGGTPLDMAAGDGGAGYLSRQQQQGRDVFGPLGAGGEMGTTGRAYGERIGAPRSSAQASQDLRAGQLRGVITNELGTAGNLDTRLAMLDRINPGDATTAPGREYLQQIKDYQVAANTEISYAEKELAQGKHAGNEATVYRDLAEMNRFADGLAQIRSGIDPTYASDRLTAPRFGAGEDVTAQIGESAAPSFAPVQRGAFTGTPGTPDPTAMVGQAAVPVPAAARQQAGQAVIGRGAELQQAQQGAVAAGVQRGYRIIGNQSEQTTLGGWLKNGVGGVTPPVLPFAPFHIHSAQFWARTFADHPAMAAAVAQAVAQLDDYGTLHLPGGQTVSGLIKLLTGAHIVDWVNKAVGYQQAVSAQGNNNFFQQVGKNLAYNTVGNNGFVRPFPYITDPAQAFVQQHTNPLLSGKTAYDAQGRPYPGIDPRDVYKESGTMAGLTGAGQLANDALGQPLPRNVVGGITNPGQALGNAAVRGLSRATGSNLKLASDDTALAYFAGQYAQQHGFDPKDVQQSLYNPTNANQAAFGQQIRSAFQQEQDSKGLGRIAPVQIGQDDTAKGIFPPTAFNDNAQSFFDARDFAGEGGKDAGVRVPTASGGYRLETPDRAQYNTARNQLELPPSLSSAPTADYARDYLQRTGYQPTSRSILSPDNAGTSARFDQSQRALTNQIAGNASRFGAGLPQDQRTALLGAVGTELAPNFTTNDLINQPGNVRDLIRQYEQAKAGGASKEQLRAISDRINDAQAKDLAQFPATKSYFDFENAQRGYTPGEPSGYATWDQSKKDAWDAFNNLRSSPDYKRYQELQEQQAAAGPFGSPGEKAWYASNRSELTRLQGVITGAEQSIVDRYGINPRQLANDVAVAAGRNPTYATTEIKAPSSTSSTTSAPRASSPSSTRTRSATYRSGTSSSTGSRTTSGAGSYAANQQAGDDFYNFYSGLTSKADKATVLDALDRAGVNPLGQKGVSAQTFERALSVAQDALTSRSRSVAAGAATGLPGTSRYEPVFYQPTARDAMLQQQGVYVSPELAQFMRGGGGVSTLPGMSAAGVSRNASLPGASASGGGSSASNSGRGNVVSITGRLPGASAFGQNTKRKA